DVAEVLSNLARERGLGLMVTPSRRTGADNEAILRARLDGLPAEIWDGTGENPYFAYLGLADAIIVTADSVNMVCEAASTGKPVYVIELEGESAKFDAFHESMRRAGITRPFDGRLDDWSYQPLCETERAAAEVWRRMASRSG
ncbi:MAG TPA: ELM1/GtrOC1 family putative glycosyltransferase, partial [Alphaproteobacteria bacterium]|nr:ELM1/GtrOC1 family putative glycosyltransferase [Alphaproteobacteria bacterium]